MNTNLNKVRPKTNFSNSFKPTRRTFCKGQMEIMGLVIIIILISLAILFVLQFIILRPQSDLRESFTHKEIAANTVNSMLDTTTDCRDMALSQLLIDCTEGGYIQCPTGNSCNHASNIINTILEGTLDQWNKEYSLTIKAENQDVLTPFGNQCIGEKTSSAPCCILPTAAGPIQINLDICT